LVNETRAMRLGVALDYESDMGGLSSADQLDKARAHVEDAVAKGAKLLCGGRHRPKALTRTAGFCTAARSPRVWHQGTGWDGQQQAAMRAP
jgi:acyl-CoA reductase-like NAD-dependent aldehyde dehydrogenase